MTDLKIKLHDGKRGSALAVRVTPRASRNEIVELLDDGTIKVRIAAPPADNEANEALIEFLSDILGASRLRPPRVPRSGTASSTSLCARSRRPSASWDSASVRRSPAP